MPIVYGLEAALENPLDPHSKKYYRAFVEIGGGMDWRTDSGVYEACDAADVMIPGGYLPLMTDQRDKLTSDAAVVRATMEPYQKSPSDMERIALEMADKARSDYARWYENEERERLQLIEDEEALKSARTLIRGLQLIFERSTEKEREALKMFLQQLV